MHALTAAGLTGVSSPERLSLRYEQDEQARKESGYSESTFQSIFDHIDREGSEV